ncbi:MAG: hypothetical protein ABWK53_05200 [Anaerolineales bacterium]
MKIIDKTPFISENGEISLVDRAKATMKYGPDWYPEVQAQQQLLPVFSQTLDRNYTLLRNVIPPGLGAMIPFILVGPTGVFVMYVTHLRGVFRAKGDQWGTISGNTFKPHSPNLLNVTARMARAVQVYLTRQGYEEQNVEAVLLCADPGMHVDSQRPIVRVVMRDALERFLISLGQGRVVLTPERASRLVEHLLHPRPAKTAESPAEAVAADPYVPAFALPAAESQPEAASETTADWLERLSAEEKPKEAPAGRLLGSAAPPPPVSAPPARRPAPARKRGLTPVQWAVLAVIGLIELCALIGFAYILLSTSR